MFYMTTLVFDRVRPTERERPLRQPQWLYREKADKLHEVCPQDPEQFVKGHHVLCKRERKRERSNRWPKCPLSFVAKSTWRRNSLFTQSAPLGTVSEIAPQDTRGLSHETAYTAWLLGIHNFFPSPHVRRITHIFNSRPSGGDMCAWNEIIIINSSLLRHKIFHRKLRILTSLEIILKTDATCH